MPRLTKRRRTKRRSHSRRRRHSRRRQTGGFGKMSGEELVSYYAGDRDEGVPTVMRASQIQQSI